MKAVLCLILLMTSGCALLPKKKNYVKVDLKTHLSENFKDAGNHQKKYYVIVNDKMQSSISSQRIAGLIKKMLRDDNYIVTDDPKEADFAVVYAAGIGSKTIQTTRAVWNPGKSFTVTNYNSSNYSTSTSHGSTSGSVSYVPDSYDLLIRWLDIHIFEAGSIRNASDGDTQAVWIFEGKSIGNRASLNEVSPYMLSAAFENFLKPVENKKLFYEMN